jgi:hypothetical protein
MLRLTVREQDEAHLVLAVDGWIAGAEVGLLETEGERWLARGRQLTLDLRGTRSIDEAGLVLLRRWTQAGVVLHHGLLFVRTLLAAHGLAVANE